MYSSACVRALAPGLAPALFCGRACSGRVHPESPQHSRELRAARQEAGPSQREPCLWADVDPLTYIPGEGTVPGLVWCLLRVLLGEHGGRDDSARGLRSPPLPGPGAALPPSPCPAQLLLVTPTHLTPSPFLVAPPSAGLFMVKVPGASCPAVQPTGGVGGELSCLLEAPGQRAFQTPTS